MTLLDEHGLNDRAASYDKRPRQCELVISRGRKGASCMFYLLFLYPYLYLYHYFFFRPVVYNNLLFLWIVGRIHFKWYILNGHSGLHEIINIPLVVNFTFGIGVLHANITIIFVVNTLYPPTFNKYKLKCKYFFVNIDLIKARAHYPDLMPDCLYQYQFLYLLIFLTSIE